MMEENFKRMMMCRVDFRTALSAYVRRAQPVLIFFFFFFNLLSCESSAWLIIHMKCQDYSLKKIKVKLFSTAVVIGALRVK